MEVIKKHSGVNYTLKYLEYLINERNVSDSKIHTELVCMYIQCIKNLLNKIRADLERSDDLMEDESVSPPASLSELTLKADKDLLITEFRVKLMTILEGGE